MTIKALTYVSKPFPLSKKDIDAPMGHIKNMKTAKTTYKYFIISLLVYIITPFIYSVNQYF